MKPTLTLTNTADYGNLIVALQEAQGGQSASAVIGTQEQGTVEIVIPGKQS